MVRVEHEQNGERCGRAPVDAAEVIAGITVIYGVISPFLVAAGIMTGNEVLAKIGIPGCAGDICAAMVIGTQLSGPHT